MRGLKNASKLLGSHKSIEKLCAEKTELLLDFLDELFCDVKDAVESIASSYVFPTSRVTEFICLWSCRNESMVRSSVESLRLAMEKSGFAMHWMRLEFKPLN